MRKMFTFMQNFFFILFSLFRYSKLFLLIENRINLLKIASFFFSISFFN